MRCTYIWIEGGSYPQVSFKGKENNSIIQPQLKPNGVNVRLKISTLRFQVLLGPVPCNKMLQRCGKDKDGRQWPNLCMVTYE